MSSSTPDLLVHIVRFLGGPEIIAAVFLTFVGVFCVVLGFMDAARKRHDVRRRAISERGFGSSHALPSEVTSSTTRSLWYESLTKTSALLSDVERVGNDENEASKIKKELLLAGYFGPNSVLWYQAIRYFLMIGLALTCLVVMSQFFPKLSTMTKMTVVLGFSGAGFLAPSRFVSWRRKKIIQQCQEGFPDFIDLMVICVEAGLSPRAAIDRISKEIAETYPYFGANLYLSNLELHAGTSLHDALYNLARRTKVEEAATLASLLQQTEQLGTSITDALRIYSEEMRDRRLVRAEEKANALPVKLILPLGVYVFPVMLVVILLPVIIRMKNAILAG